MNKIKKFELYLNEAGNYIIDRNSFDLTEYLQSLCTVAFNLDPNYEIDLIKHNIDYKEFNLVNFTEKILIYKNEVNFISAKFKSTYTLLLNFISKLTINKIDNITNIKITLKDDSTLELLIKNKTF